MDLLKLCSWNDLLVVACPPVLWYSEWPYCIFWVHLQGQLLTLVTFRSHSIHSRWLGYVLVLSLLPVHSALSQLSWQKRSLCSEMTISLAHVSLITGDNMTKSYITWGQVMLSCPWGTVPDAIKLSCLLRILEPSLLWVFGAFPCSFMLSLLRTLLGVATSWASHVFWVFQLPQSAHCNPWQSAFLHIFT